VNVKEPSRMSCGCFELSTGRVKNLTKKGNKSFSPIERKRRERFRARIISEGYIDYREDPDFFKEEKKKRKPN